jgi:hypothetical protein
VNRAIINFLASMRLFLDHTETRLDRRYGRHSRPFGAYKQATAAAHDARASYRILYNMRNYVQHCGMPIEDIQVRAHAAGTTVVKEVAVECDANILLDRFDDWRHAKTDLEGLRPQFAIAPLVEE